MKNDYNLDHIIDSFYTKGSTKFLNRKEYLQAKNKIPKRLQKLYQPYENANKVIIYKKDLPDIGICKITFNSPVRHPMILKELFNLGLKEEMFGDIIVEDNIAYIYIFNDLYTDIKYNFTLNKISIKSIELLEILVSSLRIDYIISSITNDSRKSIVERFKNKDFILNYDIVTKNSILLEPDDIFSIRHFGKYKFNSIVKNTKKGGYIISVSKYK